MNAVVEQQQVSLAQAVQIASEDSDFYGRFFFPQTCRQPSPDFHKEMWSLLLSTHRHIGFEVFRGGAKTSVTRLYVSFCVAFGLSRTIVVVGKSEGHAVRSVSWLQKQVEFNKPWATAFGLQKGNKWADGEIEIFHGVQNHTIRVLAIGMTGSTRGINVDDYRPDLIILDDPCDEENTATVEQRKKTEDLVFGSLDKSLAPRSEAPMAKMVLLQTPLNKADLINQAVKSNHWKTVVFSCYTSNGQSQWPERWTTDVLNADKQAHVDDGKLPTWLREMECKIVSEETAAFPEKFLKYWEVFPDGGRRILAIDPTPPPKEHQDIAKSAKLDDCAVGVIQASGLDVYVLETYGTKSPDTYELINKIFELCLKWGIREVAIETILFARTIKSVLEREMLQRRQWLTIHSIEDKRKKPLRIRQEISALYTAGRLHFHKDQSELIGQLLEYPEVNHDDYLDMVSIGLLGLSGWRRGVGETLEGDFQEIEDAEYPALAWEGAP